MNVSILKNFLIMTALMLLGACSQNKTTKTSLTISNAFVYGASDNLINQAKGGLVVWGQSSNGKSFGKVLNDKDSISIMLPNETWSFYAMAWEGEQDIGIRLVGKVRCARSEGNNISDALSAPVELSLTNDGCEHPAFAGDRNLFKGTAADKVLAPFNLILCKSLPTDLNFSTTCNSTLGFAVSSFRLRLESYENLSKLITGPDAILTKCYPRSAAGNEIPSQLQIPKGITSITPFRMKLEFFTNSTNCSGDNFEVQLPNGAWANQENAKYFFDTNLTKLFIAPDPCFGSANADGFAAGDGSSDNPHIICTVPQLYKAIENAYSKPGDSYKLKRSLNLDLYSKGLPPPEGFTPPAWYNCLQLGENFLPIGYRPNCEQSPGAIAAFTGVFDGAGNTITGLRIRREGQASVGFFSKIGGNSIIKNINFNRPEISGLSNVGALVGTISTAADSSHSISNIKISNAKISARASVYSYVGGIIGRADVRSLTTYSNLNVEKSHISGNGDYIGGVIGHSHLVILENAKVDGIIESQNSKNYVGGIAGSFSQGVLSQSRFEGMVKGGQSVGGLVGASVVSNITTSYAQASVVTNHSNTAIVGGLVGELRHGVGISNSYFYGKISHPCHPNKCTDSSVGNAIGVPYGSFAVSNVFYLKNSNASSYQGTGLDNGTGVGESFIERVSQSPLAPNFKIIPGDLPRLKTGDDVCETEAANTSVADQISTSRGTSTNPILLCRESQLQEIGGSSHATNHYKLIRNFAATSPTTTITRTSFSGTLDGNGYGIIGFNLDGPSPLTWWDNISSNGVIKNLTFLSPRVNSTGESPSALLAGTNNGKVTNVSVKNLDWKAFTGGSLIVTNTNSAVIDNYQWDGMMNGSYKVGGIVQTNLGKILNSRLDGSIDCNLSISSSSCSYLAGVANLNGSLGIISGIEINTQIRDDLLNGTYHSFVANSNEGSIQDIHIRKYAEIRSKGMNVHAISVENVGTIQRVFNEGNIYVQEKTNIDGSDTVSPGVAPGIVTDNYKIIYANKANWIHLQKINARNFVDEGETCKVTLENHSTIWASWIPNSSDFQNYALVRYLGQNQGIEVLPLFSAPDGASYHFEKISSCASSVTNLGLSFKLGLSSREPTVEIALRNWSTWQDWNTTTSPGPIPPLSEQIWVANMDTIEDKTKVLNIYKNHFLGDSLGPVPTWEFDSREGMRLFKID